MGPVESRLSELAKKRPLCFVLIDSESLEYDSASNMAKKAEALGADAILVGGSSVIDQIELDGVVASIKASAKIPVILFPGNITGISAKADAILFSSLLNSENPYFITQAQALGALYVKKHGLEAIPMGYLVIGEGSSVWFIGRARGVPMDKPKLAVMHALAAKYMGMRALYLEAGSGVQSSVKPEMVSAVRRNFDGLLLVGGGIKDEAVATSLARAGADVIVIGTLFEEGRYEAVDRIVRGVRSIIRN
ncbi:MAG: geranylgeranylglyceryl/heptaprenylglyceryl phosphate synthase [Candidatus Nitrosocaldus sp.]|nr:geranylgeranylglyceryl/heptaprenylglyceryl phosphate synthase [Candidatus Nitrosocaldus sp.]MCS7141412.1 geranylgeranylglyceryl/heptaprenylglyceryl phosphate synthase [Candidatus Nitrosocaldus sp.]MDW8000774.1 geranylgeranylglyceryl/heptaprenylglyceryl phosphate synthase [Candidatus Nitrosocaldus sp.]MDW8275685.1 geranylgeranylglyceryl/heptaprenylglyceryl phosphate synthase [Candidatus Nitrosocaldus sp.]